MNPWPWRTYLSTTGLMKIASPTAPLMFSDIQNQRITTSNFPWKENGGGRGTMRGALGRKTHLPNRWIEVFKTFFYKNKNTKSIYKTVRNLDNFYYAKIFS